MAVTVEVLMDVEGRKAYRVARVFPNMPSAECAMLALERINPAAFEPVGEVQLPTPGPPVPTMGIVVDEDDPLPGCATGVCGLD